MDDDAEVFEQDQMHQDRLVEAGGEPMSDGEITRQLALKVMGWPTVTTWEGWKEHAVARRGGCWAEIGEPTVKGTLFPPGAYLPDPHREWKPMESIVDAWEVRNRLAEWGSVEVASRLAGVARERAYFVPYVHAPEGVTWSESWADSAARCICLAALRAVGLEPE